MNEFIRRAVPCRLSAANLFTPRKIWGTVGGERDFGVRHRYAPSPLAQRTGGGTMSMWRLLAWRRHVGRGGL